MHRHIRNSSCPMAALGSLHADCRACDRFPSGRRCSGLDQSSPAAVEHRTYSVLSCLGCRFARCIHIGPGSPPELDVAVSAWPPLFACTYGVVAAVVVVAVVVAAVVVVVVVVVALVAPMGPSQEPSCPACCPHRRPRPRRATRPPHPRRAPRPSPCPCPCLRLLQVEPWVLVEVTVEVVLPPSGREAHHLSEWCASCARS